MDEFISPVSVQDVPSQSSVFPVTGGDPPKATAAVAEEPQPLILSLAVFKFETSVQEEPFQVSASAELLVLYPPNIIPEGPDVPPLPSLLLAVLTSDTAVQLDPFQLSALAMFAVVLSPDALIDAVKLPKPVFSLHAVFKSFSSVNAEPL